MIKQCDIPLVSQESMNQTHFDEVVIINEFVKELDNKANFDALSTIFENFLAHMQEHFSGEEKLMQELNFPAFRLHKADHDKVLNQTRYAQMMWRNKKDVDELKEYIQEEIIPWLDQHIKAMDTPMADFVSRSLSG